MCIYRYINDFLKVFILFKLLGNSSKSHLNVVGDFRGLYLKLWARIVAWVWGGVFVSSGFPTLLCCRADFTVDVNQSSTIDFRGTCQFALGT